MPNQLTCTKLTPEPWLPASVWLREKRRRSGMEVAEQLPEDRACFDRWQSGVNELTFDELKGFTTIGVEPRTSDAG